MKVALYARVSTHDRDQDPETQLVALRDHARAQGWDVHAEYVDRAPANDLLRRTEWRRLLDDAARRRFGLVLVFKLDRAFRSVKHMHDTLDAWERIGVGFQSVREGFDTRTALGCLLLNLLTSLAEFELELISERVRTGMDRARRQGKHIGRPSVMHSPGFEGRWASARFLRRKAESGRPLAASASPVGEDHFYLPKVHLGLGAGFVGLASIC
ncbi:recombinase family protein [Caldinitratiruptor microaerophilus]|uniref:Resolvase/invertase-type recombinase catalytic domain-containing protein n=1 Tax=Caldinitratiruptor microaerophilus TaxID=671077 RepID=A0AA35CIG2_9FIRM|nr:recombinase family protein [Caldinitratiruptor microaerophilus]BDG59744.1 hypothetical protein caldi_08340 [Caldinitratiruptor microaerophilus]